MGKAKAFEEQAYPRQPFLLSTKELVSHLRTNVDTGLEDVQVQDHQRRYGANKLDSDTGVSWYSILGKQIANAMILVRQSLNMAIIQC